MPTLAEIYLNNDIRVACGACRHLRVIDPWALAQRIGWDTKVEDLSARMRCTGCGSRRCTVDLVNMNRRRR